MDKELAMYIEEMCQCKKQGGRILFPSSCPSLQGRTHRNARCILLVDVAYWTDDMATCTKHRFPNVSICVQQSRSSLSGFCVIFTFDEDRQHHAEDIPAIKLILLVAACIFFAAFSRYARQNLVQA